MTNPNQTRKRKETMIILFSFFLLYTIKVSLSYGALKIPDSLLSDMQEHYGTHSNAKLVEWIAILRSSQISQEDDILYEINNFFNEIPYYTDLEHWGKPDYWSTPVEMLCTNGGDCEDYVIAKYFSLRALGIPDSKLRMMFVTALQQNQAHMVLAYYPEPNAIPLILDNINPRILPANQRRDLRPVYSFNGEGLYKAKAQGRGTKLGNSRHKMWDDLTSRIERDL